jgi:hypothetical protein
MNLCINVHCISLLQIIEKSTGSGRKRVAWTLHQKKMHCFDNQINQLNKLLFTFVW